MKKKLLLVLAVSVMVLLSSTLVFAQAEIVVRVGHMEPPGNYTYQDVEFFARLVDQMSNGRIRVENHGGGVLGSAGAQVDGLVMGTHDVTLQTSAVIGYVKEERYWDLPFLFEDHNAVTLLVQSDLREEFEQNYRDYGLVLMGYLEMGFRHVVNTKNPVYTPQDMDGFIFRAAPGPTKMLFWETMGLRPIVVSFAEVYEALDTGVIDGLDGSLAGIAGSRFYEVCDYVSLVGYVYNPMILVAGEPFWNSLPTWAQDILLEASLISETASRYQGLYHDLHFRNLMEQHGTQVNDLSPEDRQVWLEASKPVYEEVKKDIGDDLFYKILEVLEVEIDI